MIAKKDLKTATQFASIDFFTRIDQQNHWELRNNPRVLIWTTTILTKWEYFKFHEKIANAFKTRTADMKASWKEFEDFDRLTEVLLTQGTSSAFSILKHLPTNTDLRMPNRILVAAQNISLSWNFHLIPLLNDHLTKRQLPSFPPLNSKDIEVILDIIGI